MDLHDPLYGHVIETNFGAIMANPIHERAKRKPLSTSLFDTMAALPNRDGSVETVQWRRSNRDVLIETLQ